jgi:hypothetical protein
MKPRIMVLVLLGIVVTAAAAWASGGSEEGGSRGVYLSARGTIMPAKEIQESSFIAAVNYGYPEPAGPVGVSVHTANRQVPTDAHGEIVVLGLQGRRTPFENLPPLNLAFVIDHSGSMAEANKLAWVKESFDLFIRQVRDDDFVSLVIFDDQAQAVFRSTRIKGRREDLASVVRALAPAGGTDIRKGLELGYKEVLANFRADYVNWVLLLTDGQSSPAGLNEMAESYRRMGVGVSTIGLGQSFNADLMRTLARSGGGTSRFVADRQRMVEIFGPGLSRMIVPAARDVEVTVDLAPGVRCLEAWAPDASVQGSTVTCRYPVVQTGDYETIVLKLAVPRAAAGGARLGRVHVAVAGVREPLSDADIAVQAVERAAPVDGIGDAIVLRAATMLRYAQTLKQIGERYYAARALPATSEASRVSVMADLVEVTNSMKKQVLNARMRLDDAGFDDEINVLDGYLGILGGDAKIDQAEIDHVRSDREIASTAPQVPLVNRLEGLFSEVSLDASSRSVATVAVSGFGRPDKKSCSFLGLLDELASTSLRGGFKLVERRNIEAVLAEQQLSVSDLVETSKAIRVGRFVSADYILTGTVVPMQASVVVFCRLINTTSGEVESAAQVIVPIDADLRALL